MQNLKRILQNNEIIALKIINGRPYLKNKKNRESMQQINAFNVISLKVGNKHFNGY